MRVSDVSWTERYRPDSLDDVIGQEEITGYLKDNLDDSTLQNLLFSGPAGTGKTAVAKAFAKDKYGDDYKQNFRELNASDDRGIDIVRNEIKSFAKQQPTPGHDFKLIFLDESDALTKDAQSALRRVMEDYADRTRFILSCNYPNKLIDPIQSRCYSHSFSRLDDEAMEGLMVDILDEEEIEYELTTVASIVEMANGDARDAINTMQGSVSDSELNEPSQNLTVIDDSKLREIVDLAMAGDTDEAHGMMLDIVKEGYDTTTISRSFLRVLRNHDEIPEDAREQGLAFLGDAEFRVNEGSTPHVQWNSFLSRLIVARHRSVY